jgi:hypothetical protein
MRFPDRPVVTAGMAIACALAVLALLSSPATLSTFSPASNVAKITTPGTSSQAGAGSPYVASNGTQYAPASSTESSTTTVADVVTSANGSSLTTIPPTATVSSIPNNLSTPSTNVTSTPIYAVTATESVSSSTLQTESQTTINENATATTLIVPGTTVQSASSVPTTLQPASAEQGLYLDAKSLVDTVGIIAVVALIVAFGSMLYVKREVDKEEK